MDWKNAYLESRILSADRLELVSILYEHAIASVEEAVGHLEKGDIRARSRAISKSLAIIIELENALNYDAGGEIAANLGRLYRYMRERLTVANVKQDAAPLLEVGRLLKTVGEAWKAISAESGADLVPAAAHEVLGAAWPGVAETAEAYSRNSWTA